MSHLGGATTQTSSTQGAEWDDNGWVGVTWLSWWTARHGHCQFTFCAVALGQRLCDSDVTLKDFLSRRQVDAFQSKHRDSGWHFTGHSCCDSMPNHYSWRVVCLVCVWQCVILRTVCTLLLHYLECFPTSHYLTTLTVIFSRRLTIKILYSYQHFQMFGKNGYL